VTTLENVSTARCYICMLLSTMSSIDFLHG
jgi:hypothetical protein